MYAFLLLPFSVLSQRRDLRLTSGGASGLVVAEALDPKVVLHVLILGVETLSAGGQLGQLRVLQGCQIVPWRWFQTFVWGLRQCRVGGVEGLMGRESQSQLMWTRLRLSHSDSQSRAAIVSVPWFGGRHTPHSHRTHVWQVNGGCGPWALREGVGLRIDLVVLQSALFKCPQQCRTVMVPRAAPCLVSSAVPE
ncbi:hypothetical protein E2C01_005730 [Portunus trituberculatus]|uniref:Uncharacterized protein n=1 Tax=Portunus trituberculatus TaxID=210409 RepID=A0A5B7CZY3_PORTR|nr:hypothetical protein [Portunus trituberculatus]